MRNSETESGSQQGPGPEDFGTFTESPDAIYVYEEAVGDTTVRPMGPEIPRDWPRPQPRQPKAPE
jgi:hypothetical protein